MRGGFEWLILGRNVSTDLTAKKSVRAKLRTMVSASRANMATRGTRRKRLL